MTNMKLGKKPPRFDRRTLQMAKYLRAALPIPPDEVSYIVKVPEWPMLLNDTLGDCVIAAMGHMVQQWTYFASGGTAMQIMTDAEALAAYEAIAGYSPSDPTTDQGTDMLSALNYWRKQGIMVGGKLHKIGGYVAVDTTNALQIQQAIWIFGNLFTGLALPATADGEDAWTVAEGGIYGVSGEPGSWGGHCVPVDARSPITATCVTWGTRLKMSHNFFFDYCDEAYAVLSPDWIGASGLAPSSFNMAELEADLKAVTA